MYRIQISRCFISSGTGTERAYYRRQTDRKTFITLGTAISQKYRVLYSLLRKAISINLCTIGQRVSTSVRIFKYLSSANLDHHMCISMASITSSMTAQYMGPLISTAISEYERNCGAHCFLTYDDFSKHSVAFRQLCLFLRKPAGREAFPSDVFYLHARILERSCCLSHFQSLGTLMSLPIIETLSNDLSAYIATNVISITDGQLYLDVGLFGIGSCPAVSMEKSVSRVGAKSLDTVFRAISFRVYLLIGDYKQEIEIAAKSEMFKIRQLRFGHILAAFIQRSSLDR
jgi:F0F1-type ATP synthase alpha subunit